MDVNFSLAVSAARRFTEEWFFSDHLKARKGSEKTVNILKNKNTALSGQMINKLSVWQDFLSVGIPSISVKKSWGWILYLLFDHNKLIHWYKMESAIQQKQPRPHIFSSHLFLQLQWTENKETPKSRLKSTNPLQTADKRRPTGDEERKRLKEAQHVKKRRRRHKNNEWEKPKSEAEERCSAAGGAVWFLWPGSTARQDAYPPHSLTKQPQSLPSEHPQTLHIEYIQNQSHLSHPQ